MAIRHRSFCSEDDYHAIRGLLLETCAVSSCPTYCTIGDLDWWRFNWSGDRDRILDAHLWECESGMLVGVAWPGGDEVDIFIRTHHEELLDTILTWAEVFRLAAKPPETAEWPLHVMCLEKDLARKAILNQRGYVRTHTWYSYRSHSLGDASSSCLLPQGYSIRPISSVREIPARAEVHRLAFAGSSMNPERYGRIMASPTYRQELDLVATCPDGTFAGFCLAWLDTRNHLAAIEPLGVRPEYRGIGLGRALVQEAMCRARQAGAITAIVVTGGTNVGANKLYEALAFDEKDRGYRWRKTL